MSDQAQRSASRFRVGSKVLGVGGALASRHRIASKLRLRRHGQQQPCGQVTIFDPCPTDGRSPQLYGRPWRHRLGNSPSLARDVSSDSYRPDNALSSCLIQSPSHCTDLCKVLLKGVDNRSQRRLLLFVGHDVVVKLESDVRYPSLRPMKARPQRNKGKFACRVPVRSLFSMIITGDVKGDASCNERSDCCPCLPPNAAPVDARRHARTHSLPQLCEPVHSLIPLWIGRHFAMGGSDLQEASDA